MVHLRSLRVISTAGEESANDIMEMGNMGSQYQFRSAADAQLRMEVIVVVVLFLFRFCIYVLLVNGEKEDTRAP